jgi:broad specificity phosphatase PhoE
MTRVWLVRHASTDWTGRRFCGRTDIALSARGLEEAALLSARLATALPDDLVVVTSPAARAVRTSELLVAALPARVPIDVDPRLAEVDFGDAEGLTFDEVGRTMPALATKILAGGAVDWPGGESATAVRDRARSVWLDITRDGDPAVVVSHGGLIRALLDVAVAPDSPDDSWIEPATEIELAGSAGRWHIIAGTTTASGAA